MHKESNSTNLPVYLYSLAESSFDYYYLQVEATSVATGNHVDLDFSTDCD
jgi:hypothetical protein